jgi:hypothetical protein
MMEKDLRATIQSRHEDFRSRKAQHAFDRLLSAEAQAVDLTGLVVQADQFLGEYPDIGLGSEVRRRRSHYLNRLDEQDIQPARNYSALQPFNFQTRRELYQRYLDRHPGGGVFTDEAETALDNIAATWDRHDFRAIRDQFTTRPGDIPELVARCRAYLTVHPQGRFTSAVAELLRWTERVTVPGEYRVVLRRGDFEHNIAYWLSRGPDLAAEIEVGGVRHGPSPIVKNRYDPDWSYEFPRRIRWKLGDPVVIRVTDYDWFNHVVLTASSDGDPMGMRLLSGEARVGNNYVVFESDFAMPTPPSIE